MNRKMVIVAGVRSSVWLVISWLVAVGATLDLILAYVRGSFSSSVVLDGVLLVSALAVIFYLSTRGRRQNMDVGLVDSDKDARVVRGQKTRPGKPSLLITLSICVFMAIACARSLINKVDHGWEWSAVSFFILAVGVFCVANAVFCVAILRKSSGRV